MASQCPACFGSLTSTFLGLEHQGELAECRSCGRPVRSRTAVCPHCGIPKPARRHANPRVVLPVIAAALLTVMAVALRDRAFQPARADSTVAHETTAAQESLVAPPVVAPPVVAVSSQPQAESARVDTTAAQPVRAVETAGSKVPVLDSALATNRTVPEEAAAMDSAALVAAGLQRRWTTDWSNLHRTPHNESPVVRVLPPGTEVHVAENKWGWWAILWKGDTVGYVAGALLRPSRPR